MSDDTTTTLTDDDIMDVGAWLAGTTYPRKVVEVFNDKEKLLTIAELQETIAEAEKTSKEASRHLNSIDVADAIIEAKDAIEEILASLKGTGLLFELIGIDPGELKLIGDTTARKMKPIKTAVIDPESGATITEPHKGGREHPDYTRKFEERLIARCIVSIKKGTRALPVLDAEGVSDFRSRVHPAEFRRLSNAVSDLNYSAYDIDKEVTVDFS